MRTRHPQPDRHLRSEPFEVFTRPQRSRPARLLGLALRLRAEITTAGALLFGWLWLAGHLATWNSERTPTPPDEPASTWLAEHWPPVVAGIVVMVLAVVVTAVPQSRRYVHCRALAVLTRHRLRAVFVQRRVMNWTGNLPVLLWSRPTPVGERVWVLLRAGIDAVDIERNLPYVASGCFARDARVTVARSMTALVLVDVVRRDPLAAPSPAARPADVRPQPRPALHVVPAEKGA